MTDFNPPLKALFFDVFGTCVDWRKTVTNTLWEKASDALGYSSISHAVREKVSAMTKEDWGDIAQEWRNTYLQFTRAIAKDPSIPYKTVDQHHLDALREILTGRGLISPSNGSDADSGTDGDLWDSHQIYMLSLVWHWLEPWPDTVQGLHDLNKKFSTCTLSNGNVSLLEDMVTRGNMPFTHVYSAEMFRSYKPNPKVYLGAAEKMGARPEECMMVAAHLDDLKHAKACGLRTLYVERPREERYPELRNEDVADIWVSGDEEGFVAAAEKLIGKKEPSQLKT